MKPKISVDDGVYSFQGWAKLDNGHHMGTLVLGDNIKLYVDGELVYQYRKENIMKNISICFIKVFNLVLKKKHIRKIYESEKGVMA